MIDREISCLGNDGGKKMLWIRVLLMIGFSMIIGIFGLGYFFVNLLIGNGFWWSIWACGFSNTLLGILLGRFYPWDYERR